MHNPLALRGAGYFPSGLTPLETWGGRPILQRRYEVKLRSPFTRGNDIKFSISGRPGFPIKRALCGDYTQLDDRDAPAFARCTSAAVNVRLEVRCLSSAWALAEFLLVVGV